MSCKKIMRSYSRHVFVWLLTTELLIAAVSANAQGIPRIAVLRVGSPAYSNDSAFRQALRELGYTEPRNILIEYRYAEGRLDRLAELSAEVVRSKPDVIVVGTTRFAEAVKHNTSTIPIVVLGGDIVGAGLVSSLAHQLET